LKQEFLTKKNTFNAKKAIPDEVVDAINYHTNFLNYSATTNTRVSYLLCSQPTQLLCNTCNVPLKISGSVQNAPSYCSSKCSASNPNTKLLKTQTNLNKYGVSNPSKNTDVREKSRQTFLRNYGVDNPSKNESVKQKISTAIKSTGPVRTEKIKKTVQAKYGVDHISKLDETKQKKKNSFQEQYNTDHYWKTDEFKTKMKEHWSERGVSNPSQLQTVISKIAATKQLVYGDPAYNNSKQAKNTMNVRYGTHPSRIHWSLLTHDILENAELLDEFSQNKTVNLIAKELGVAPTTIRNRLYEYGLYNFDFRKNQYETLIEQHLTTLGINFIKNDRTVLNGQELDFYIPQKNLAIECNGIFWHSELMGKHKTYHLQKTEAAAKANIRLLHFWDFQVDRNPELVLSMITHALGKSPHMVGARKTQIHDLTPAEYKDFLDKNHLQQAINSKIKLGLFYKTQLVAVMGLGKSRFKSTETELHRFAVKQGYNVAGAASKLFNFFLETHQECHTVISYADRDYSVGNLYTSLGFNALSITPPSYIYFKNRTVYNRIMFQKHKLSGMLEDYDPNLEYRKYQI
jgi:very-short-patch-repair endonuclease